MKNHLNLFLFNSSRVKQPKAQKIHTLVRIFESTNMVAMLSRIDEPNWKR